MIQWCCILANAQAHARMSSPPDLSCIPSNQDELLSMWCGIVTYLLPRLDTAGKSPVWSTYTRDLTVYSVTRMLFNFWWGRVVDKSSQWFQPLLWTELLGVGHACDLFWVSSDLGKYLATFDVDKWPGGIISLPVAAETNEWWQQWLLMVFTTLSVKIIWNVWKCEMGLLQIAYLVIWSVLFLRIYWNSHWLQPQIFLTLQEFSCLAGTPWPKNEIELTSSMR